MNRKELETEIDIMYEEYRAYSCEVSIGEVMTNMLLELGILPPQDYKGYEALEGWEDEKE